MIRIKTTYVRDLSGSEYACQTTITQDYELNGNQSLTAVLLPSKVNRNFIDDIAEMWSIFDFDEVEHRIVYVKKRGEGITLSVEIKAVPAFFDDFDTLRIYDEYNEHMTAQRCFALIFADTPYSVVLNGSFDAVEWQGLGGGETRLEMLKRALERYKAEFRIVGNTVYVENLIGRDTQFQYRYRLNASNIIKEHDATALWTYARGYGDYEDSGEEGEGGGWESAKLKREYTSPLAQIIGIRHAPPIKDGRIKHANVLDAQLKTLVDESLKISISADIRDLRRQGYPLAQPQMGDRVFVIDERIGLDEEVRVVAMTITRNWRGDVVDCQLTFGSDGVSKRYQSNLSTAVKDITEVMAGRKKIPFSVLDNAVQEVTNTIKGNEDSVFKYLSNGVIGWNGDDPNYMTRYVGDGIGFSRDGGATFEIAMTAKDGIVADVIRSGSMLADRIAGGILSSLNGKTVFNLNDGLLTMEDTEFRLGGGADIRFTDSGNRLYYQRQDTEGSRLMRSAGVGFGRSINDRFPFVYLGTSTSNKPTPSDTANFSGFIANVRQREHEDNIGNSVVGHRFHVRDNAVSFRKAFLFNIYASTPYFSPINTGVYNYDLASSNNRFNEAYLKNNPNISSDKRIKTDISTISLDFAKKFLSVSSKRYKKKLSNADLGSGIKGSNPYEFGFIAQEVETIFEDADMRFESLVSTSKDGSKSLQYGQIPAIHHVLLKDIYSRLSELERRKD